MIGFELELADYIGADEGRPEPETNGTCIVCQQGIRIGQDVDACECCGQRNTCCEELVQMNGHRNCRSCVKAWEEFNVSEVCKFCDEKGIRGEMVKRADGGYSCEACAVFKARQRGALVLESLGGRAA